MGENFTVGRVEDGRGSLGPEANDPFPIPAHLTERADSALGLPIGFTTRPTMFGRFMLASPITPSARNIPSPCNMSFTDRPGSWSVFAGSLPITRASPSSEDAKSQGPLLLRRYPALTLQRPCHSHSG